MPAPRLNLSLQNLYIMSLSMSSKAPLGLQQINKTSTLTGWGARVLAREGRMLRLLRPSGRGACPSGDRGRRRLPVIEHLWDAGRPTRGVLSIRWVFGPAEALRDRPATGWALEPEGSDQPHGGRGERVPIASPGGRGGAALPDRG